MANFTYRVRGPKGLHARPAARIAAIASKGSSRVEVALRSSRVFGVDPLALMALDAKRGDDLFFTVIGDDEDAVIARLHEACDF